MNLKEEYYNMDQLLRGFYENDVPFNINSLIKTLRDLDGTDIDEEQTATVYYVYEENEYDRNKIYMTISFSVYDKIVDMSYEIGRILFEAVYVDRVRNDDIKIIKKN